MPSALRQFHERWQCHLPLKSLPDQTYILHINVYNFENLLFSTVVSHTHKWISIAGKHEISALTLLKFKPRKKIQSFLLWIEYHLNIIWNYAISLFKFDVFKCEFCEKIIFFKENLKISLIWKNVNNKGLKGIVVNRRCLFINKNQSKLRILAVFMAKLYLVVNLLRFGSTCPSKISR